MRLIFVSFDDIVIVGILVLGNIRIQIVFIYVKYTSIPIQMSRDNMYLILFPQDTLNLKYVINDHVSFERTFRELKESVYHMLGKSV